MCRWSNFASTGSTTCRMSSVCMVMPVAGSTPDSTATNIVKFAPYPSSVVRSPNTSALCSVVQSG